MQATQATTERAMPREASPIRSMRSNEFRPRRAFWPGLLGAAIIGGIVAAAVVSNYYDDRTVGERVDASVAAAGAAVNNGVEDLRGAASGAAQGTAEAADRVAGSLGDAVITAAVKTALAADPSLSAAKIDVSTTRGSVRLEGPAPDTKSRQRAEVLALAPNGVVGVENRLVVAAAKTTGTPVNGFAPAPAKATLSAPQTVKPAAPVLPAEVATPTETPAPAEAATAPPTATTASPGLPTNQ